MWRNTRCRWCGEILYGSLIGVDHLYVEVDFCNTSCFAQWCNLNRNYPIIRLVSFEWIKHPIGEWRQTWIDANQDLAKNMQIDNP